jgi:FixJ family two-component response regulator
MNKPQPMIAIVDDDESVCRAIKRLVRSIGMKADTYTSSQEFVEMLEGVPWLHIDCVILDVQMPHVNGLEVQQRLVRRGKAPEIIFISAHDEAGVRERALAAGALAFLCKPFNDELLVATLREALKRSAADQVQN